MTGFLKAFILLITLLALFPISGVADKEPIFVGGSIEDLSEISVIETEILMGVIFKEIFKDLGETVLIKLFDNSDRLFDALRDGTVKACFTNTIRFIEWSDKISFQEVYTVGSGIDAESAHGYASYVLLLNKSRQINTLGDLKGKKVSVPYGHEVGEMFLDVLLMENGLPDAENLFEEISYSRQANSALIDLFFGKSDAALVTDFLLESALELNPQLEEKIIPFSISPPYVHVVITFNEYFSKELLTQVDPFILRLHEDRRMSKLFKQFRFQKLIKVDAGMLDRTKALITRYKELKGY